MSYSPYSWVVKRLKMGIETATMPAWRPSKRQHFFVFMEIHNAENHLNEQHQQSYEVNKGGISKNTPFAEVFINVYAK